MIRYILSALLVIPALIAMEINEEQVADVENYKKILERGFDINALGPAGRTPLTRASLAGELYVLQFLLKQPGIDIFKKDKFRDDAMAVLEIKKRTAQKYIIYYENLLKKPEDWDGYTKKELESALKYQQQHEKQADIGINMIKAKMSQLEAIG
jgi:hypothetical protein